MSEHSNATVAPRLLCNPFHNFRTVSSDDFCMQRILLTSGTSGSAGVGSHHCITRFEEVDYIGRDGLVPVGCHDRCVIHVVDQDRGVFTFCRRPIERIGDLVPARDGHVAEIVNPAIISSRRCRYCKQSHECSECCSSHAMEIYSGAMLIRHDFSLLFGNTSSGSASECFVGHPLHLERKHFCATATRFDQIRE